MAAHRRGAALPAPASAAQPRAAIRRGSLPVGSLQSGSAMATWKSPRSNQHAQDDSAFAGYHDYHHPSHVAALHHHHHHNQPRAASPFQHAPAPAHDGHAMKFIHRSGAPAVAAGKHQQGVHKLVPPTTGFDIKAAGGRGSGGGSGGGLRGSPSPHAKPHGAARAEPAAVAGDVELPEGTLHVWVYQARHLVFRRLFETMYERHGLRLRVYAGSRTTQDVGEIYETRRNYGGNMANPRWRRDQDDARDDAHGHFSIPLARKSLRAETELTVQIVCGILVVAETKISLPALFLGSFGTTIESLAEHNVQFRPHWFPLAGEDAGLIEMALEFIPTRIVKEQHHHQQQQPLHQPPHEASPHASNNQPESEYDDYDDESVVYDQERGYHPDEDRYHYHQQQHQQKQQYVQPPPDQLHDHRRHGCRSPDHFNGEKERDRQRAREYEALERHEQLRRQRFEMLQDPHETRPQERARSATTASSSSSSSSARSTRFVLPRRHSISDLDDSGDDARYPHAQARYEYGGQDYDEGEVVIMDAYDESSPPPSEFSGYELHDSRYAESTVDEPRSSTGSEFYDDMSLSVSSSWASVSSLNDSTSQENMQNKQLWDLYRYGISDEALEEIDPCRRGADSMDASSLRDSAVSMSSVTSSMISRKMSTMSQASNYSIAFSDASEASMLSREASTCASEILTYNDRIQRMEEAIRMARERRLAEETAAAAAAATAAAAPAPRPPQQPVNNNTPQVEGWKRLHVPAPISTAPPVRPAAALTAFGWERPMPPLPSPATSEPVVLESRKGVVLFDMDQIPVKGQSGQTDPALEAYRAKMLARRRSLPIHMLSGGGSGGFSVGAASGLQHGVASSRGATTAPTLAREVSAPTGGRVSTTRPDLAWPIPQARAQPKHDPHARQPNRPNNQQQPPQQLQQQPQFPQRDERGPASRPVGVVDSPLTRVPSWQAKKSYEEPARSSRSNESERNSTSSIDGLLGPPGLRRKRSSSLHSISDLLRDQSFRVHNIAVPQAPADAKPPTVSQLSRNLSRQSISDHSVGRSSASSGGERKLSHASSYASSDASSTGQQVVPAAPRVRRNSKGGGNVVQVNGVPLGIGKFINVGNVPGVIRYIGPTMFAPGQWIGIELVEKKGKHNGTVQNVQYFECAPEHGIFIRAERLDIST